MLIKRSQSTKTTFYDSIYKTVQKRQIHKDRKTRGCQGLGGGWNGELNGDRFLGFKMKSFRDGLFNYTSIK